MAEQRDIWLALEQWKADNQNWNHRPDWQVDQLSGVSAGKRSGEALVWLGRNLTALGLWLQNRYGDAYLVKIEPRRRAQTSRG